MMKEAGGEFLSGRPKRFPKTPEQKKDEFIKARIKVKDEREDAKSRQINVSWAINAAINFLGEHNATEDSVEVIARRMLLIFDKLYEERSQEQARKYEVQEASRDTAEHEAGDNATE